MDEKILEFTIFCIESLAERLNVNSTEVYNIIKKETDILDHYIIPCYEPLHSQSKKYIVDDLVELLKEKDINI